MEYVVGSALTVAIVLLIFAATIGLSTRSLRPLRRYAYVLSCAIAALVTAPDLLSLLALAVPSLALFELTLFLAD